MYKAFYGLKSSPFQISTDPTFLWLGEKHREAISMLRYGIQGEGHQGLVLLTGDAGTGKTTLINALFKSLDKTVIRVSIINPSLDSLDFLNYIATAFGSRKIFSTKSRFLIAFERFLKNAGIKKKKVLLVIDEAQLLTDELLEEVRLLANFEKNGRSLIHIFLVGQQELRDTLSKSQNTALKQRITLNYHIDALVPEETEEYIKYRLQVAGTSGQIFNPEAVRLIHRFSLGLPRQINIICDHALLTGYVRNLAQIPGAVIKECVKELSISRFPASQQDTPPPGDLETETQKIPAADARPGQPRQTAQQPHRLSRQHDTRSDLAGDPTPPVKKKGTLLYLAIIALAVLLGVAAAGFLFL
ncbi:MAG: AAA family ATPase [Desulfotignum sp.]|nr:AAA family ATPase [Desulfotignum sp.]